MSILSDLRKFVRGELNEVYLGVPVNDIEHKQYDTLVKGKDRTANDYQFNTGKPKILIRMGIEATDVHGCSIKVQTHSNENGDYIIIPTKSFLSLPKNSKVFTSMETCAKKLNRKTYKAIESFIYDNQMAIIAYWYCGKQTADVKVALSRYLATKMRDTKYYNISISPKTDAELEKDKEALNSYVRKECKDNNIELFYGS